MWGGSKGGRKKVVTSSSRHYQPELRSCLICGEKLKRHNYLSWRKSIQRLVENIYVTSRGCYCPKHQEMTYLSAAAANLSLPGSTYGLDVLVRIGYLRDYYQMSFVKIREALPAHIRVSERHLRNLYGQYQALLACAERLDVEKLKKAASEYGGLILSVDGLQPEGGQQGLWVAREILTGTILAAGWLPRDDETRLVEFLKPVKALDLPFLATVSDKQASLINALNTVWKNIPHQYCQAHYFSNAVNPLYRADEQMKTQMRKQIRQAAGLTMREAQARTFETKNNAGIAKLCITGLAISPPSGLHEVKAAAQATIQSRQASQASSRANDLTVSAEQPIIEKPQTIPTVDSVNEIVAKSSFFEFVQVKQGTINIPARIPATPVEQPAVLAPISTVVSEKKVSQIIVNSAINTSASEKNMVPITNQAITDSQKPASNPVDESSVSSSAICDTRTNQEQPDTNVKPRQIMDDIRAIAANQGVLVYQRINKSQVVPAPVMLKSPTANQQELVDEIVSDYATRLRRVLSRRGRKPFRLAGLRLYPDLLALLTSLEVSLTHLTNEPRLTCFADAIRCALKSYEHEYISIAEGYSWVLDISEILDVPLPEPNAKLPESQLSGEVQTKVNAYLQKLSKRTDLNASLLSFRQHLLALTERYAPGLFYCYDIAGLPRTNNNTESLFGRVRRQTLLTSGSHHAKQRLHEQGAWLLFEIVTSEHEQLKRLERVSLEDWQKERQRMLEHQATFTANRRFRRNTEKYLAELEARAAQAARLSSES